MSLRFGWAAVVVGGLLLTGCGDEFCTNSGACPIGPAETQSQERWRLTDDATVTLTNLKLGERRDVPLATGAFDFSVRSPAETCDTATVAPCSQIDIVFSMRLPTIEHDDPETGELTFVTKQPEIAVVGAMSLDAVSADENAYRAVTLDARTCSSLQSSPPDGPFRGQGYQGRWTSQLEFHASREGERATLNFRAMPLTLTSNEASCEPFKFELSGDFELER